MLITEAELRAILGLASSITDNERAVLTLVVPAAIQAVEDYIGYNPLQAEVTEILPRVDPRGGPSETSETLEWKPDPGRTRAVLQSAGRERSTLQLGTIPVRSVSAVYVDTAARHGQASGAFAAETLQAAGSDYWVDWDQPYSAADRTRGLCGSGCLYSMASWPTEPGTVLVTYRAGYSYTELAGRAYASAVDATTGEITMARINASGIKRAAAIAAVKAMHTWMSLQKSSTMGWRPGALASESAGDYSYSLAGGGLADLKVVLPDEAKEALEPFVHYGRMRL
jgi:hypothetical protein